MLVLGKFPKKPFEKRTAELCAISSKSEEKIIPKDSINALNFSNSVSIFIPLSCITVKQSEAFSLNLGISQIILNTGAVIYGGTFNLIRNASNSSERNSFDKNKIGKITDEIRIIPRNASFIPDLEIPGGKSETALIRNRKKEAGRIVL